MFQFEIFRIVFVYQRFSLSHREWSEPFLPNCFSQGVTFWRLVTNRSKQYLVIMLTRLVALTMDFTPRQVYRRVFLRLWTSTLPHSRISSPLKAYAIFLHFLHWLAWNVIVRSFFSWSSCSSLFHSLVSAFVYFIKFHLSPSKTWMQSERRALSNGHSTLSCLHFTTLVSSRNYSGFSEVLPWIRIVQQITNFRSVTVCPAQLSIFVTMFTTS